MEWMLCRIKSFDPVSNDYVVEDSDESGNSSTVSAKLICSVPLDEESALSSTEFKLKQSVMALFPGTTCFYTASIVSTPSRRKKGRDYLVKFLEDDVPSRPCSARFVIPIPEKLE